MLAVLLVATMFTMIATSFVVLQQSKKQINRELSFDGQTMNAAQAGLIDALSWFRRQQTQPVDVFAPVLNTNTTPPINETDDASIGLVREYEISDLGNVVGRYEVRANEVRDVSTERGKDNQGTVWELTSHGIVYVQNNASRDFDQSPNVILTETTARTEIQRLTLVPPANAAVCASRGDAISTESKTRVFGNNNIAIAYPDATGFPVTSGDVNGAAPESTVDGYNDEISAIFGVTPSELVAMSDAKATGLSDFPDPLPGMSLVVVQGNIAFTPEHPLVGVGVLIVFGDLTIESNSASNFSGLIYVDGDYEQNAPSAISGSVIATGSMRLRGSSDFSEVNYDPAILAQIQKNLGQYRFTRNQSFGRTRALGEAGS